MQSEEGDPRRVGLAAFGAATGYIVALFAPGLVLARLVFGALAIVVLVGACLLAPMPAWREASERRVTARNFMVGEAIAISGIATLVAVAIG